MKVTFFTIFTILGCLVLSGCNTFNAWKSEQRVKAVQKGKDTCGRRTLEKFVGTSFDDFIVKGNFIEKYGTLDDGSGFWEFEGRTYLLEVFDIRKILSGEDEVVLANLSPKRLRIFVRKDGSIDENFSCG